MPSTRHVLKIVILVLVAGGFVFPLQAQWTPEEMMKVKTVGSVQVSPDGKRVIYAVTEPVMTEDKSEYLTQIWMAAADGSGDFQFTFGDKSSTNPRWSPCGKWIAFTSDRSGKTNIWLIRADGGEAERLTDVKSGVGSLDWSPDGRSISFTMADPPTDQEEKNQKARNDACVVGEGHKMSHIWVVPVVKDTAGKREIRRLTQGAFTVNDWDWSPDGKSIVFSHQPSPVADDWTRMDISVVDVASAAIKPFTTTGAAEAGPLYSPDGVSIAYIASNIPPTWARVVWVMVAPADGGAPRKLAATFDEQPDLVGWSADGRGLYYSEANGTVTRLGFLPVDGGAAKILNPDDNSVFGASLNLTRIAFGIGSQSWDRPAEAFLTSVDAWSPRQVSKLNADSPKHPLGKTELIRWKSKDGLEIEGLLTYPVGAEKGRRYPLALIVHGGPAGVFVQSYIANRATYPIAAFAAQGWAVLRCNIRGSSGYGKKFRHANIKDWGKMDFHDLMTGVDRVIAMGVADAGRLGVMGWSYGGYMTSWIITQTKRFKAASIGAPVTNLMSFTGTADIPSFIPDYFGVEFWDNPALYLEHSAMFKIKGATTPTLIQHGDQDVRVPIQQGYELYNALKRQGTTVKLVIYPRQPHGLREPRLVLDAGRRNIEWFQEHLK